jgi:hypothetical protein
MLTHSILLVLAAACLAACHRLSPAERSVIGTWRVQEIDGAEYMILGADHSYAFVAEAMPGQLPRNTLVCEGSWRIEGDDLVTECTMASVPESQKGRPGWGKHVERARVGEFFKGLQRHAPITYERLPSI